MQVNESLIRRYNAVHTLPGFNRRIKKDSDKREFTNCVERLLLSDAIASDGIFNPILASSAAFKKFTCEIGEKKISIDPVQFLSALNSWTRHESHADIKDASRSFTNKKTAGWIIDIHHGLTHYFNIIFLPKSRVSSMRDINPSAVTAMLLRYQSILSGGQHWALPRRQFLHLVKKYSINHEGFASPINTGLFEFGGSYCSLFPEDSAFGAIGSFFDQTLYSKITKNWVVNPPFIESVINRCCIKIADSMSEADTQGVNLRVVLVLPAWSDMTSFKNMQRNKYCRHISHLGKGRHFYESMGQRVVVKSRSTVFVFDTEIGVNYSDITDHMKC